MDRTIFDFEVSICGTCHKLKRYSVPKADFNFYRAKLNFNHHELISKSGVNEIDVSCLDFSNDDALEVIPEIEVVGKIVFVGFWASELPKSTVVRVFLKLQNNCAQSRAHQSFQIHKV